MECRTALEFFKTVLTGTPISKPALIYLILVPAGTRILKHSAGQYCTPKPLSALFLSFFQ